MELDQKDKKLLYWLDQNSRATNKELAKRVGLSEQAIGYRLERLEKEKIIKKYISFINTLALGYSHYKVFIRLQNVNPTKEEEIISSLVKNNNIRWVVSCSGKWDISFSIMAKNPDDFVEIYRLIENKFGNYIDDKEVFLLVKSPGFTKGYLIGEKSTKILEYSTKKIDGDLDKTDKGILKIISQNARENMVAIAEKLETTIDVVRYRLKKLESEGIISGYATQLGFENMGVLRYSVFFSLHKLTQEIENKMLQFAKLNNNIVFMITMIGTHDLSLELEVPSHAQLESIIKRFREEFTENIKNFEIVLNTHEYKYNFYPF